MMLSDLYVRDICLEEQPPRENYLHDLPVVRNLYEQTLLIGFRNLPQLCITWRCINCKRLRNQAQ